MDDSDRLSALRRELAVRLGPKRYELWLGPHTGIEFADGELAIGCPTQFECQWLRSRLHAALQSSCRQVWGDEVAISYYVLSKTESRRGKAEDISKAEGGRRKAEDVDAEKTVPAAPSQLAPRAQRPAPRNKSTFANFVVGKGNELACGTAQSVVAQPGHYGPLLLFGPPGVGKTHLCYAMLQQLRQSSRRVHAVRLTAEQFTGEFLSALDRRSLPSFRQKYRSVDVLFIDDIQFLVGKRATLDELLHTIDTLHERGRQVVLTCDRSPGDLQKVSPELVSRISGGLSIPLESPDFATRLGIVRQLAMRLQVSLDEEVIALIATQVAGSARQLAGAINRLVATSMAHKSTITTDLARTTLAEFVQQNRPAVRLADIQRAVCEVFGVEPSSLKSARKTRSIAEPRMLAMWLARKYTRAALGEISEYFGRRSHSTVVSAQKKVERLVSQGGEISVADRPCQVDEAIRQVEAVLRTA
ncbi:MAG: chromosomal replication initiator protein DnaA [Planctomycetes bacterium]|nr:chromosomal replication initiator protein DnaA [Planctomycetota bacterium]